MKNLLKQEVKKVLKLNLLLAFILIYNPLYGAESSYSKIRADETKKPLYLNFGLNFGLSTIDGQDGKVQEDQRGYLLDLKSIFSYYKNDFVYDVGGGWFYSNMKNDFEGTETRALFSELSVRYRLNENWQLGPIYNHYFGTDVSHLLGNDQNKSRSQLPLIGLRLNYEIPNLSNRVRLGVQGLTDVTLPGRQMYLAQADLQIGFSIFGEKFNKTKPKVKEDFRDVVEPIDFHDSIQDLDENVSMRQEGEYLILTLSHQLFNFDTDSTVLTEAAKKYLKGLGVYLRDNNKDWEHLSVEGHTDIRGTYAHNIQLSLGRSASVMKEILTQNVFLSKITQKGFGPNKPLDRRNTMEAYDKNRRVELKFKGLKKPVEMSVFLKDLRIRSFKKVYAQNYPN